MTDLPGRYRPADDALKAAAAQIQAAYDDYTTHVSPAKMAMSLEACTYIWWLCDQLQPRSVCDMGSGFTSYVLRKWAAGRDCQVSSVDDSPEWLEWTGRFLDRHSLSRDGLIEWSGDPQDTNPPHDLIVYDFGGGATREGWMPWAFDMLSDRGVIVFDDAMHGSHQGRMKQLCGERGLDLYGLEEWTSDYYQRYAALAVRPEPSRSLRAEYERLRTTPSDIYEHLPVFVDLCRQLDARKVIELGTRSGVSTVAWLYGLEQQGGELWSVDIDPQPDLAVKADRWTFVQGDDLDPDVIGRLPDNVDIVFIDTSHAYEDTLAELNVYRWMVRPGGKIVLHDTELRRPLGLTRQPPFPVKTAVEEFCREEWLTWRNLPNCFGLGIIDIPEV